MFGLYNLFKFLHVTGAVVWLGGVVTISLVNARLARTESRDVLAAMARQSEFFGSRVIGPAAGITLLAGFATMGVGHLGFPFWVIWGLTSIVVSMALGATLIRRDAAELAVRAAESSAEPRIRELQRRLARLNTLNVVLLFSAVWAMVFKPSF